MNLTVKQRRGYIVEAPETVIRKNIVKLLEVNCDDMYYQNGYNLSIFWNLLINIVFLYKIIKNINLSQKEFAKSINTTESVISAYEKGHTLIQTSFLYDRCNRYSNR